VSSAELIAAAPMLRSMPQAYPSAERLDEEFAKSLAELELQNLDHFSKFIKVARDPVPVGSL
jgi:hypothetical protein